MPALSWLLNLDFAAGAATISASISGTADTATEAQIVAGGRTVIIELNADTWVPDDGAFAAVRQAIIDGLDSAQSEGTGWNAEVRDKEVVGAVARTSATIVTITLSAAAAFDITANETVTVTVPAAALVTSGSDLTGSPTIGIVADVEAVASDGVEWTLDDERTHYTVPRSEARWTLPDGRTHWTIPEK